MLIPMVRVEIFGLKHRLDATLSCLQELGIVHLEDACTTATSLQPAAPQHQAEDEFAALLPRIDSLLATLPRPLAKNGAPPVPEMQQEELIQATRLLLNKVQPQVEKLVQQRDALKNELAVLPRYASTVRKLLPLVASQAITEHFESVVLLIDSRFRSVLDLIRAEVQRAVANHFEMMVRDVDPDTIAVLLVVPKHASASLHTILNRKEISSLELPESIRRNSFEETLAAIELRLEEIPKQIDEIHSTLEEISNDNYFDLALHRKLLHDCQRTTEAKEGIGLTEHTFLIAGWVPKRDLKTLSDRLMKNVGPEITVQKMPVTKEIEKQAPVCFENPRRLAPFEFLVRLQATPAYGSYDPTPLVALFLPIFFGMMVGDIAHGAIIFALTLWISRRYRNTLAIHSIAEILKAGSVWAILFGIVFGEFFGTFGERFGLHPFIDRSKTIVPLFVFAIALGAAHVLLGMLLGLWQSLRTRQSKLLTERSGAFLSLIAVFALAGVAVKRIPAEFFTPAIIFLLIGFVLMAIPRGFIGLLLSFVELLGIVGNVLSYLRLAAIGLASVYLSMVANQLAGASGSIWLALLVATLFHSLNIALSMVSPTIQSIRLHYVEFFSKFFEPGGRPYRPFCRESMTLNQ